MKLSFTSAAIVVLMSISSLRAQDPDPTEVVKNSDWDGMMKLAVAAQKSGDNDLAKRQFLEAWSYASFWAVYDPTKPNSGSRRDSGIRGMISIRTAAGGLGLDDTFRELDDIRAETPPKVFSGGKNNIGIWQVEPGQFFTLKQNGSYVTGSIEVGPANQKMTLKFEGKEFDGTRMQVELSMTDGKKTERLLGTLNFNGNRLSGTLRNASGGSGLAWGLDRAWQE